MPEASTAIFANSCPRGLKTKPTRNRAESVFRTILTSLSSVGGQSLYLSAHMHVNLIPVMPVYAKIRHEQKKGACETPPCQSCGFLWVALQGQRFHRF